jgi:cytochrome c553
MDFGTRRSCGWALVPLTLVPLALACSALTVAQADDAARFFETEVRPLLATRCQKCHGAEAQKGDLRLNSRAAVLAGGESGAAIVPGKPGESLLMEAVRHESLEMPPDGKLSDAEIDALARWIEMGAPWPGSDDVAAPTALKGPRQVTDEDRSWWAFQPVKSPAIPEVSSAFVVRNEVDRFIAARLAAEGLHASPEADKRTLIRRATFDLHGLPPTPAEVAAFLADESPQAYEKLIDRLLDSPRYGERWARHWLDLVRYAESDGYKQDDYRPTAWRYRDYVIAAFNADKPYDRFIKEQLAGDEIAPDDPQALVATGYLQLGIYEYNQRDVSGQRDAILNEITDVTADVFLGQGLQCARCHDHKFDPLLQKDYYRLRAFFEAYSPCLDAPVASPEERAAHVEQLAAWETKTVEIRQQLEAIEQPIREATIRGESKKFPEGIPEVITKKPEERSPQEQQLSDLAFRQINAVVARIDFSKKLKGDELAKWQDLKKRLAEFDAIKPQPLPTGLCGSDIRSSAPPTIIPGKRNAEVIEPGPLSVLDPRPMVLPTPALDAKTTGRRRALAEWIAQPSNPLTSRVMVNRIWQYHFGRGLVNTSSDLGHLGELPSHPELLDYLAHRFVESGWSIKAMHRLMMTSAAYRQSSALTHVPEGAAKDPANRLLWRQNLRRLDAEQIRDALLAVSGELDLTPGGPSAEVKEPRRTIFTKLYRNKRDPLLDVFDVPDGIASMPQRNVTTTPLQSLLLINSPWMLDRAKALAVSLHKQTSDDAATAALLYERLFARLPSDEEKAVVVAFLKEPTQRYGGAPAAARERALTDLCHALLNSNAFLFVD